MWLSSGMTVPLILYLKLIHYPKHLCGGKQHWQGRLICLDKNWSERTAKLKKSENWTQHKNVQLGLALWTCQNPRWTSAGRSPRSHYWSSSRILCTVQPVCEATDLLRYNCAVLGRSFRDQTTAQLGDPLMHSLSMLFQEERENLFSDPPLICNPWPDFMQCKDSVWG